MIPRRDFLPLEWLHEATKRQQAHVERNKELQVYNYVEHLPERRKIMSWWANYLDELAVVAKVIYIYIYKINS